MKVIKTFLLSLYILSNSVMAQKGMSSTDISVINFSNTHFFELLQYPLEINLSNGDSKYFVEGDENSKITIDSSGVFNVIFHGARRRSTISVFTIENEKKILIVEKEFSFYPLPITPLLKKIKSVQFFTPGETISIDDLEISIVSAGIINYNVEKFFPVTSFSIRIPLNGKFEQIIVKGDRLEKEHLNYFKRLESGQPIIFDNILIKGLEEYEVRLYPLVVFME